MYVQSDTLSLADAFENSRNVCLKIYKLNPEECPGLVCQTAF